MLPRAIVVLLALVLVCGKLSLAGQQPYPNDPNAKVLSLEEAVNMALADNLNLQTTIDTVSRSQIGKGLAESRFDFKLTPSLAGGFGSEIGRDRVFGFQAAKLLPYGATVTARAQSDYTRNQFGEVTGSLLTFTVAQPLLRGFGRKTTQFDLTNAKRSLQSSGRNLEMARQRLAVEVVASYYNIVRQQGLVDVAEKSAERSRELLRASEARLKVGLASKLDVFRAELQLSQAEQSLIIREEALELALDTFKFNLGLNPQGEVYLEMVEPDYQPVVLDLDAETRLALTHRLEIREERDRIDDARRSLSVSRKNLLPQLDLNLRYQQSGLGETFRESLNLNDGGVSVFVSTSYPIDQSAERASVAQSNIDLAARRRAVRLLEYNVTREVRAAARNVERVGKSIVLQERNIEFAEKQLRLASLRYQRGLASNFDIIDAENNLISARSNYVSFISEYNVALIELKRVNGTLDLQKEFAPGRHAPPARHHP